MICPDIYGIQWEVTTVGISFTLTSGAEANRREATSAERCPVVGRVSQGHMTPPSSSSGFISILTISQGLNLYICGVGPHTSAFELFAADDTEMLVGLALLPRGFNIGEGCSMFRRIDKILHGIWQYFSKDRIRSCMIYGSILRRIEEVLHDTWPYIAKNKTRRSNLTKKDQKQAMTVKGSEVGHAEPSGCEEAKVGPEVPDRFEQRRSVLIADVKEEIIIERRSAFFLYWALRGSSQS